MISFAKRKKFFSSIGGLGFIIFLTAVGISVTDTIWAVYLYSYLHSSILVGLLSTFFTIISLLSSLYLIPFLETHDSSSLYLWTLFLMSLEYILFAFTENLLVIVILGVFLSILTTIRINCFGILVSDNSKKKDLAQNEGIIYTTANCGWLIGPLLAAFVSRIYDIPFLFVLSAFFLFFAFLSYWILSIPAKKRHVRNVDGNMFKNISDFFHIKIW